MTPKEYLKLVGIKPMIYKDYEIIEWKSCLILMEMYHDEMLKEYDNQFKE